MLAPLRVEGVNVVLSSDGIIVAGAHVGIMLDRPAKNRVHMIAVCTDDRMQPSIKDFAGFGEAIAYCVKLVQLDLSGKLK